MTLHPPVITFFSVSPLGLVELDRLFLSLRFFVFCFESLFYMDGTPPIVYMCVGRGARLWGVCCQTENKSSLTYSSGRANESFSGLAFLSVLDMAKQGK